MVDLKLPEKRKFQNAAAPWKRTVSFFVDFFIIYFIIILPFTTVITETLGVGENFNEDYKQLMENENIGSELVIIYIPIFVLIYAYFVIFEYKMRQTPGKMLFKLYLKPIKKEKITIWKVLVRNLAALPFGPLGLLWIIDPLYLFITGRRFSDAITKTQIVEEVYV